MKHIVFALSLMGFALSAGAQSTGKKGHATDSMLVNQLSEVVVSAVRAPKNAPFAVANIRGKELRDFSKTGSELPHLFARTPGVVAWSENGLGSGTTYMRIRGAAGSRINVTLDGVCLNSPEDQTVFWANMNSYGSFLGSAQIQRGVGTSTNGDGAFGGTISLQTIDPSTSPMLEVTGSYGYYNTYNVGTNFSTGTTGIKLKKGIFAIDGAYHHTGTDGFIHGTAGNSGSYYGGLTYINEAGNLKLSYKNVGNYEKTGQAWNGVETNDLVDWNYNRKGCGITDYQSMYDAGLGRYNGLYERLVNSKDPTQGTERYKMRDGSYWKGASDNFWQNTSLLGATWNINDKWNTTATLRYTYGYGYYDELKANCSYNKKFGVPTFILSDNTTLETTDVVREKYLNQNTYTAVLNAGYHSTLFDAVFGVTAQQFVCAHYGYLSYMANQEMSDRYLSNGDYKYYDSDAKKNDVSTFAKGNYHLNQNLDIFADLQYRYVNFNTDGTNDKFIKDGRGGYKNQSLDINETYHFLNPKAGVSYHKNGHNAYASFALSNREPERNNFTDNGRKDGSYDVPRAERVLDYELGYNYKGSNWHAGANFYYMDYVNQLVATGAKSEIGEALTTNIDKSYRLGVELTAGINPTRWLSLEGNAALSQNKIKDFTEWAENWDDWSGNTRPDGTPYDGDGYDQIHYDNSTLSFSPSVILNGFVDFHHKGFKATWHTGYVSRQYMDNTECKDRSLAAYTRTDVNLSYTLHCGKVLKQTIFGLSLNNIFNSHYASNGWVYSAIYASKGNPNTKRYANFGYNVSSGFTMMGNVTFKF